MTCTRARERRRQGGRRRERKREGRREGREGKRERGREGERRVNDEGKPSKPEPRTLKVGDIAQRRAWDRQYHTHTERERERERERGSTRRARWPTVENERVKGLGFRV